MRKLFYFLCAAVVVASSQAKCCGRHAQFENLGGTQIPMVDAGECDCETDCLGQVPSSEVTFDNWVPKKLIPYDDFLKQVKGAKYEDYPKGPVRNSGAFEAMRSHILTTYNGIDKVAHSFVLEDQYVDCIDIKKQPSVRIPKLDTIKTPPRPPTTPATRGGKGGGKFNNIDSPLKLGLKDAFGNAISCPNSTIPLSRITLEKLTKFATLANFFEKTPDGAPRGGAPGGVQNALVEPHLYAFSYQNVNNHGGSSYLNVWTPVGEFSLSQQWYDAGSGSTTQTVEGGWIVYPAKFGTTRPVLFIFFTPDNYASGCYNLDCTGFVQTSSNWVLGGPLTSSVMGGAQNGIQMTWTLSNGAWWLFLTGTGAAEAVGYYPISVFRGGPLATNAVAVKYGGEVVRTAPTDIWPQMGSSVLPSGGYGRSAFQKTIYYIPTTGGTAWTTLTGSVIGLPACWSITITPSSGGGDWGTYFYHGGPGGRVCN